MSGNRDDEVKYWSQMRQGAGALKNASIMMVDDEILVMEVLKALLQQQGYSNFTLVSDSKLAFDTVLDQQPDVLLLDLNMPDVSGFDILQQIRNHSATQFMAVIVLTSATDSETKLKALELGATDFLAKPVDGSELALRLRNTLAVKAYQDQLAYYDGLTQLPNRRLFLDHLHWAIVCAQRDNESVAMLLISLDRYSTIRDTLGPNAGDSLVAQVSKRLVSELRSSDTISQSTLFDERNHLARISPHEFSVLLPGVSQVERLSSVAERLRSALNASFQLDENEVYISGSIGIAIYPYDAKSAEELVNNASAATAHAKAQGRDTHQFYSYEIDVASKQRLSLETSLRKALEREELFLNFQPQVKATTGQLIGAEALLRWEIEPGQLVSPAIFIPLAEELGLISEIGEWVIYQTCSQAAQWRQQGLDQLRYSVNVSGYQLNDLRVPTVLKQALDEFRLPAGQFTVEVTESVLLGNRAKARELLSQVKCVGARLSIDDFGTDYASLSYLRDFDFDELKIDRSFIRDITHNKQDGAIVRAVIGLAHSMGLKVVAEGVEELAQANLLNELKCDVIQGFYYAKPMSPQAFLDYWLENKKEKKSV